MNVEEALLFTNDLDVTELIAEVEDELAFMHRKLNAVRNGDEPMIHMSEATHEAIEEEHIGLEHSTTSGHPQ